jgi:hypothetical protein
MEDKMNITIVDAITGQVIQRELNSEEQIELEKMSSDAQAILTEEESRLAARSSALAKLAALGLTEEEITAL